MLDDSRIECLRRFECRKKGWIGSPAFAFICAVSWGCVIYFFSTRHRCLSGLYLHIDANERSRENLPKAVLVAHVQDCRVYRTIDDRGQVLYVAAGDFGVACEVKLLDSSDAGTR